MPSKLLFTYGTLMRGYGLHRLLAPAHFVARGRVRGELLNLGPYPGLVDGRGTVRGELYEIDDPKLLRAIDRAEGYNFERRSTLVTLADGRRRRAWLYEYTGPRGRAVPIPEGDYRRVTPGGPDGAHRR